jgi:CBS domain containing-hemolysin-like protein
LNSFDKNGQNRFSVLASAWVEDINDLLPHRLTLYGQFETLALYLILQFGRVPNINDKISFDGYEFSIVTKNKNSII